MPIIWAAEQAHGAQGAPASVGSLTITSQIGERGLEKR
jgi:hypothetical protein